MTPQTVEQVRSYFSVLEKELREIILSTPMYVRDQELEGYLDLSLSQHVINLYKRMLQFEKIEDYERALAIKRFIKARLKDYIEQLETKLGL